MTLPAKRDKRLLPSPVTSSASPVLLTAGGVLLALVSPWISGALFVLALAVLALRVAGTRRAQEYLPGLGRLSLVYDHGLERQPAIPRRTSAPVTDYMPVLAHMDQMRDDVPELMRSVAEMSQDERRGRLASRAEVLAASLRALCAKWDGRISSSQRGLPYTQAQAQIAAVAGEGLAEYHHDHSVKTARLVAQLVDEGVINSREIGVAENVVVISQIGELAGLLSDAARRIMQGSEVAGDSPDEDLRAVLAEGIDLGGRLDSDVLPEQPRTAKEDPLYHWARRAWSTLRKRDPVAARTFFGDMTPYQEGYFMTAFALERDNTGRRSYLDSRIALLDDVLQGRSTVAAA